MAWIDGHRAGHRGLGFLILPSRQNLAAIDISDAVALTLFFGGGVFISELAEHYRRNQRQIEDYQTERALQAQQRLEQVSQYHRLALEAARVRRLGLPLSDRRGLLG